MELVSKELARYLVGTHLAFRTKGSEDAYSGVNFDTEIKFLERESHSALSVGGKLCIMFLAELTGFYRQKPYYMAVRSGLAMRRYRPSVVAYLGLTPDERQKRLMEVLSDESLDRDMVIRTLHYFVKSYPSRRKNFREVLSRSEYLQIAV